MAFGPLRAGGHGRRRCAIGEQIELVRRAYAAPLAPRSLLTLDPVQGSDGQLLAHVIAHRPADHLAAEQVEDDGPVQPPLIGGDVGDVG
jgi:hypothetical protein